MYKALPMSKMKDGVIWLPADAPSPRPITLNSPALEAMTDLRKVLAATISADESIVRATQLMIARRVRLLLVVSDDGRIEGLISARDTMGAKPVRILQERRGATHEDLRVSDLMVPRKSIDVLDIETVSRADVGSVLETLKQNGRQHALVLESSPVSDIEVVRGIFSATQIARQLGIPLPIFEIAQTFAEITSALEK
jgi:CBS domain-containing protein